MTPADLKVGDEVRVHAFGSWYRGEIVKAAPLRVHVRFDTGGTKGRVKAVRRELVVPIRDLMLTLPKRMDVWKAEEAAWRYWDSVRGDAPPPPLPKHLAERAKRWDISADAALADIRRAR